MAMPYPTAAPGIAPPYTGVPYASAPVPNAPMGQGLYPLGQQPAPYPPPPQLQTSYPPQPHSEFCCLNANRITFSDPSTSSGAYTVYKS